MTLRDNQIDQWTSHEDTGLQSDTFYCYRVRTENAFGSNVTPVDNQACGYTRVSGSRLEEEEKDTPVPVWRVQVTIRTADVSNAGTEDAVQIRLNSPLSLSRYSPRGNETWLDYGPRLDSPIGTPAVWRDDFDRGREFRIYL